MCFTTATAFTFSDGTPKTPTRYQLPVHERDADFLRMHIGDAGHVVKFKKLDGGKLSKGPAQAPAAHQDGCQSVRSGDGEFGAIEGGEGACGATRTPGKGMEANHAMNAHEGDLIRSKATESLRLLPSARPRTPGRTKKSRSGFFGPAPPQNPQPHRQAPSVIPR
jgi:hypothetical protein